MATLFLIRHGETDWNREGRWQGHDDRPLTPRGLEQVKQASAALQAWSFAAIYASDLRRARDSAAPLAAALGLPVVELAGLREIDTGSWTGLTRAQVAEGDPAGTVRQSRGETGWSGGETYDELQRRVAPVLADIAGAHVAGECIAVFSHGGVIRAAVAHTFGAGAQAARTIVGPIAHVSLTVLERTPETAWRLHAFNVPLAHAADATDLL
jgi:broad specificity phosphatase PhoE